MYLILLTLGNSFDKKQYNIQNNIINNNCEFQILRINRNQVKCYDKGEYEKYCKHYSIPNEFKVIKEIGIGNQDIYIFKPESIYKETNNNKIKLASFNYRFTCNKNTNIPNLEVIINPTYDISPFVTLFVIILLLLLICIIFSLFGCDDFTLGYIIASNLNSNSRTYCE